MESEAILISGEGVRFEDRIPLLVVEHIEDLMASVQALYPNSCIHVKHNMELAYDELGKVYEVYACTDPRTFNTVIHFDDNDNVIDSNLLLKDKPVSFTEFFKSELMEEDGTEEDDLFYLQTTLVAEKIPLFTR